MNPQRKNPNLKKFELPELTAHEKLLQKVELLLLDYKDGFFLSHIANYIGKSSEYTLTILKELDAVDVGGFWTHVVYRVPCTNGFNGDTFNALKCITIIDQQPDIKLAELMRKMNTDRPMSILSSLSGMVCYGVEPEIQQVARAYIFRKFGVLKSLSRY